MPGVSVFSAVCKDVLDKDGNVVDIKIQDEIIMLNKTYMSNCIFIFAVAVLCHEMIHYWLFGEYCNFTKFTMITKIKKDKHNTMTFETMKEEANNLGIKVIQQISKDTDAEILDKEGIELLFKKAQAEGLVLEGERLHDNIDGITVNKNGIGGSINIFS